MGTYGTTHIIKDKKKIDLTDSHDGYFSAMGWANLLSIKYISDANLEKLFKAYTAKVDEENYDEVEITERELQDVFYQFGQDTQDDKAAAQWIQGALSDDIRASVTGFGPLLYLNKNPGFNDSEVPNYIVDLDAKEFIYTNWSKHAVFKLSFDTIRQTPENILNYFGNRFGNNFELVEGSSFSKLNGQFDELAHKEPSAEELITIKNLQEKLQSEVNAVINIAPEVIVAYDKKQDEQSLQYVKDYDARQADVVDDDTEQGGFSIRSANSVTLPNLRKVIFFVQKYIEQNPEAQFLAECSDWGMNDDGATGGFRFFSPKKQKHSMVYDQFINLIESQFKIGLNGFSSSGTYNSDGLVKEDDLSMFGDNVPGPERSIYSLEEARVLSPDWETLILEANPHLIYYVKYKEAREVALSNEFGHPTFSIPWTYAALVNQDKELFEKIYPKFQGLDLTQKDKDKVFPSMLQSFSDSQQINKLLGLQDSLEFTKTIEQLGFFEDTKEKMTKAEQSKYFPAKSKKMKK